MDNTITITELRNGTTLNEPAAVRWQNGYVECWAILRNTGYLSAINGCDYDFLADEPGHIIVDGIFTGEADCACDEHRWQADPE